MKLIDNAKHWHKMWSIRLSALGAFLMSAWFLYGPQIIVWWQTSAADYFPFLSPLWIKWIGLGLVVTGQVSRIIKQEKLHDQENQ
jgi:hypothetical protein